MITLSESAVTQLKKIMLTKEDYSNTIFRIWVGSFG